MKTLFEKSSCFFLLFSFHCGLLRKGDRVSSLGADNKMEVLLLHGQSQLRGPELSQLPTHEQNDLGSAMDNQGLGKDF